MKQNTDVKFVTGLSDSVNNARQKDGESWGCLEMGGNLNLQKLNNVRFGLFLVLWIVGSRGGGLNAKK